MHKHQKPCNTWKTSATGMFSSIGKMVTSKSEKCDVLHNFVEYDHTMGTCSAHMC